MCSNGVEWLVIEVLQCALWLKTLFFLASASDTAKRYLEIKETLIKGGNDRL